MDPYAREVQYERLLPHQMAAALDACPTAFVPLGTLEWHGVQNALGLDAIKAHALCVRAAKRGGGVVLPPLFGGVGGVEQPYTLVMEPEPTFHSRLLEPWLSTLCCELRRVGFRAIILLTGHYGASQQMIVREAAVRETQRLAIPVLGTPEYWLALDAGYWGDHGGQFETSLLMALIPGLTDLSRLADEPPFQGIGGGDARLSTAEEGERVSEVIVSRLATLAGRMPQWDTDTRTGFLRAEQALVSYQLETGGTAGDVWAAWRNMQAFEAYGRLLAEERFGEIEELIDGLP
jgi:creatinine amidohydrolase